MSKADKKSAKLAQRQRYFAMLATLAGSCAPLSTVQSEPSAYELNAGLDVSFVDAAGHPSWTEGSAGKLRYDADNDGLILSRAFVDYHLRVADTVNVNLVAEIYADDIGSNFDFTESYVEWRPLTLTSARYRFKLGAFYPRISLENTGPGWSSPYTISPSAINTWVGEELRVFGAEVSVSRRPQSLGGEHTFSLHTAIFYNNDTAGGLLAWKGWSVHDRQSRFGDELPLPPLPQIQPGMWFDRQDPYITPVLEIDHDPGYYVNVEWLIDNRFMLRAMHYDNRADPIGLRNGQFAWRTDFDHVGIQIELPGDIGLLAQWIEGATVWGPVINGAFASDVEFQSAYLMLTKSFVRQRVSARYEDFKTTENDEFPLDENAEHGHAWTLSYSFEFSRNLTIAAEWLQIFTARAAWNYYGLADKRTERQLQIDLRMRFAR